MSDYLDPNNEELLKDFFVEAQLQIEQLEQNILSIENNPDDKDSIDEIFRAAHTLKGGAATVEMTELAGFTHIIEDLLDEIRAGQIAVTEAVVDSLLISLDVIKNMMDARMDGSVFNEDISEIENRLHSFSKGKGEVKEEKPEIPVKAPVRGMSEAPVVTDLSEYDLLELKEAAGERPLYRVRIHFDENNPMNTVGGIQVFAVLKSIGEVLKTSPDFDYLYDDNFSETVDYYMATDEPESVIEKKAHVGDVTTYSEILNLSGDVKHLEAPKAQAVPEVQATPRVVPAEAVKTEAAPAAVKVPATSQPAEAPSQDVSGGKNPEAPDDVKKSLKRKDAASSILRVDSKRIDDILNLVSEAVINKATFNQISNQFTDSLNQFQISEIQYKENIKKIYDNLPELFEQMKNENKSAKDIKKALSEDMSKVLTAFDNFEGQLKSTINLFKSTAANLGRTTGDLHEGVLRIRMVPIGQVFSRFPRLVRDLSKKLDKNIKLIIEGEDTELDKSVIEDLLDPLMHCVRNSIDHGVEDPEARLAAGKPEQGHILLKAKNEGNMIVIEIADDGAGINIDSVMKKAIANGVIHPSKTLTDVEAFNLIFEPGFSTAKEITNISGRGVGLDVVRRQIEKLNGSVNVWSEPGNGTRFTIKLPLTLAIIQGLLIKVGTEIYAIPITSVAESHRIKQDDIRYIDNYEVFNVRDDVISLLRLNKLFRIPSVDDSEYKFIVIVGSGDKRIGLMVDSLIGEEDVVIKPLKDHYTSSPGIAGATILGDGTVSLIIDVSQLLEMGMKKEHAARRQRDAMVLGR